MIRLDRNGQVDFRDAGVLVVDDEQYSRAVIRQSLLNIQCGRVEVAEHGSQALEMLLHSNQAFDAIISDFRMHTMDGLELLRRVRSGSRGVARDIVFGILTGYSDKEVIGHAFNLDVDFFVAKPPTIDGLKSRLSKAMTTSRPIKPLAEYMKAAKAPSGLAPAKASQDPPAPPPRPTAGPPPEPKSGIVLREKRTIRSAATGGSSAFPPGQVVTRSIHEVIEGTVLGDDVRTSGGTLILQRGFTLTRPLIERLRNLAEVDSEVANLHILPPDNT